MRIKQTTFYALRILYRIDREGPSVVTSNHIAGKEELSQGVVLKILRTLSHAGMVRAWQGRGQVCGGFSLAKSIDNITLADVIEVLEGMDVSANLDEDARRKEASLQQACERLNENLKELFSEYSIRQLMEQTEPGRYSTRAVPKMQKT